MANEFYKLNKSAEEVEAALNKDGKPEYDLVIGCPSTIISGNTTGWSVLEGSLQNVIDKATAGESPNVVARKTHDTGSGTYTTDHLVMPVVGTMDTIDFMFIDPTNFYKVNFSIDRYSGSLYVTIVP